MEENQNVNKEIRAKLLESFRLDKLCPKCGGFLEVENEIHCEKCKLATDVIDVLSILDLGVMRLRNLMKLNRKQLTALTTTINNTRPSPMVGGDPGDEIPNHLYETEE